MTPDGGSSRLAGSSVPVGGIRPEAVAATREKGIDALGALAPL